MALGRTVQAKESEYLSSCMVGRKGKGTKEINCSTEPERVTAHHWEGINGGYVMVHNGGGVRREWMCAICTYIACIL